jgi:hypothetical protein
VPCSAEAEAVLKLVHNRSLLHKKNRATPQILLRSMLNSATCYAKISFATFLGRQAISIGSSRSSEVILPQSTPASDHRLLIHFDLHDAGLLLTDKSTLGTWIRSSPTAEWQLLHNITWPVSQNVEVRFGQTPGLHFLLVIETYTSAMLEFEALYQKHVHSLYTAIRWLPNCYKRRRSSCAEISRKRRHAIYT